jgi:hypothetical protein
MEYGKETARNPRKGGVAMKGMWISVLVLFVCALASMSVAPWESTAGTMKEQGTTGNNMMKEEGTTKGKDMMEDKTMREEGTTKGKDMMEDKTMREEGTTKGKDMMEDKTMKEEKGTMK